MIEYTIKVEVLNCDVPMHKLNRVIRKCYENTIFEMKRSHYPCSVELDVKEEEMKKEG